MLLGIMNHLFRGGSDIINLEGDIIDGGIKDETNHLAPKTIKSKELTSFRTSFFRFIDQDYIDGRRYGFGMEINEDGTYIISEGYYDDRIECETDSDFAVRLDAIIREYDLIASNGVSKVTAGLPPEYGPWEMRALYASGEKLNFYENGEPTADWTEAVLELFANEFSRHGIDDLTENGKT